MPSGESGGGLRPQACILLALLPIHAHTCPHGSSLVCVERRRLRHPRQLAAGVRATMRLQKEGVDTAGAMVCVVGL